MELTGVAVPELLIWLLLDDPAIDWDVLVDEIEGESVDEEEDVRVEVVEELTRGCVDVVSIDELTFAEAVESEDEELLEEDVRG